MRTYEVISIQDHLHPFVTLDKKQREEYGLAVGEVIILKFGQNQTPSEVFPQIKQLIGSEQVIISSVVASKLDCNKGERIEIVGKATKEQWEQVIGNPEDYKIRLLANLPAEFLKMMLLMKARKGLK